jgi:hypothetical protein
MKCDRRHSSLLVQIAILLLLAHLVALLWLVLPAATVAQAPVGIAEFLDESGHLQVALDSDNGCPTADQQQQRCRTSGGGTP